MSRQFVKSFHNDFITFNPGNASGLTGGNQTTLMLWKADSFTDCGLIRGTNAGSSNVFSCNPYSGDGHIYFNNQLMSWTNGVWYLTGITKPSGTAPVRGHQIDLTTPGTWSHTNFGNLNDASNGPIASFEVGNLGGGDKLDGKLAAVGLWNSVLTDNQIESLTARLSDWLALSPVALWAFNQTDVATAVTDLTGGGANQSSINGTNVSADEPPGWSYALNTPQPGRWGVHI
jgi:hypothetical protein